MHTQSPDWKCVINIITITIIIIVIIINVSYHYYYYYHFLSGLTLTSTCLGWTDVSIYLEVVEMHT